jgi:hypothetical protein
MYKLGKKAPRRSMATPAFGDFLDKATTWPTVAPQGWEYFAGDFEMLGNDQYGDCAEAGAMHLIQAQTSATGNPLKGTLQQTLDLYTAVTGFNPSNPATDQGTDLLTLLQYWKSTGITVTDAQGKPFVHKILGWASLDLTSIAQIRYANYIFGGTYLGINCPQSPSIGGHCIPGMGQGAAGGHVVSWGMCIPFTWSFMLNYLEEGYVVLSEQWLNSAGKSPSGLDLNGLTAAMSAL